MRIGCLQFAPQVAQVDENIELADEILLKADPENLDLLVLPELAFTGYNFKTLNQISPHLELFESGISSAWAKSVALRHDCVVAVGYPEKVDPTESWPSDPEYYNSLLVIDGEGEAIANYRKSHLYYTDETWALEGNGFYDGKLPGLGRTTMGICMDLNPYKFEAPWDAYEFAQHVLDNGSRLVIVSMAWNTLSDGTLFHQNSGTPDMESLSYWISRLQPIINLESERETIVVLANRTGREADATYVGSSCVLGIQAGEVKLYGILGRGDQELLVVDTESVPFAKLQFQNNSSVHGKDSQVSSESKPSDPSNRTQGSSGDGSSQNDHEQNTSESRDQSGNHYAVTGRKTNAAEDNITRGAAHTPQHLTDQQHAPINELRDLSKNYEATRRSGEAAYSIGDMGSVATWLDKQLDSLILTPRTIATDKVTYQKALQEKVIRQKRAKAAKQEQYAEEQRRLAAAERDGFSATPSLPSSPSESYHPSELSDHSDIIESPQQDDDPKRHITQLDTSHQSTSPAQQPPKWLLESPTKSQLEIPLGNFLRDDGTMGSESEDVELPILQPVSHNRFHGQTARNQNFHYKTASSPNMAAPAISTEQITGKTRRRFTREPAGIDGYQGKDERKSPAVQEFREFWSRKADETLAKKRSNYQASSATGDLQNEHFTLYRENEPTNNTAGLQQPRGRISQLTRPERSLSARRRRPKDLTLHNSALQQPSVVLRTAGEVLGSPSMLDFRRELKTPKAMKLVYERT